jgi:surfeit locus 1 family protein
LTYSNQPPLIRVHFFGYIFSPHLIPTLCVLLLLPLLISLGVWQLNRANEKEALTQNFLASGLLALTDLKNVQNKTLQYRQIQARGSFDTQHLILIDNKIYQKKPGYYVFSPFILKDSAQRLFVNRGFVASSRRDKLPTLITPPGERVITGLIYFPGKSFLLKKDTLKNESPLIVQAINIKEMEKQLNQSFYPFYLLLQQGETSSLIKDWHPVSFPPYRHRGYAIQWFSLAFTLIIIYLVLNTSRSA